MLIGINLLREGLDLPEVSLVAILDADKEGFLRSAGSLIQTMGRAARHVEGHAILYADVMTDSMRKALDETARRRQTQVEYNERNGIVPQSIVRPIDMSLVAVAEGDYVTVPLERRGRCGRADARSSGALHRRAGREDARGRPEVRVREGRAAAGPGEGAEDAGGVMAGYTNPTLTSSQGF